MSEMKLGVFRVRLPEPSAALVVASLRQRLRGFRPARDAMPSIHRGGVQRTMRSRSRYERLLLELSPIHPCRSLSLANDENSGDRGFKYQ